MSPKAIKTPSKVVIVIQPVDPVGTMLSLFIMMHASPVLMVKVSNSTQVMLMERDYAHPLKKMDAMRMKMT